MDTKNLINLFEKKKNGIFLCRIFFYSLINEIMVAYYSRSRCVCILDRKQLTPRVCIVLVNEGTLPNPGDASDSSSSARMNAR